MNIFTYNDFTLPNHIVNPLHTLESFDSFTISDNGYYEAHVDTDDACAFLLDSEAEGTLII